MEIEKNTVNTLKNDPSTLAARNESALAAELPVRERGSVCAAERLVFRLFSCTRRLKGAYRRAAERIESANTLLKELLAEDFYIIEKHLKTAADALTEARLRQLPVFKRGEKRGSIRIFYLAELFIDGFVSIDAGRIDAEMLAEFFGEFQRKAPLTTRELACLEDALRFALIEKTTALVCARGEDASCGENTENGESIGLYSAERLSRLISGLASLSDADISETAEALVPAAAVLDDDEIFRAMDRESRAAYIAAVEKLAKRTALSETAVAAEAVKLCREAATLEHCEEHENAPENAKAERVIAAHTGYYLLGNGRKRLVSRLLGKHIGEAGGAETSVEIASKGVKGSDESAHIRLLLEAQTAEKVKGRRLFAFFAVKGALSLALCILIGNGDGSVFSGLLAFFPIMAAVDAVLMRLWARIFKPRVLPRLALENGLGCENKTLVCVPVLIGSEKQLEAAVKTLERHYLASMETNAEYCVLGDFPDSENAQNAGEEALISHAEKLINELNARYAGARSVNGEASGGAASENGGAAPIFHFLHRRRVFAKADARYMGRERKRGAVEALIDYISAGSDGEFLLNAPKLCRDFRYLLVLDADTVLPPGALRRLVGAAAHPLNRPVYADESAKKPYSGYNIMVPRMASSSRAAAKSRFCTLISGESGLSSYSMRVSDFFFDAFAAANFGGKGLIDIRGFKRAVCGAIPENTVLSHDMLEGELSSAALDSATVLYDGEPASFFAWFNRRHRWLRGDMQLAPFLFGRLSKPLGALSKYKILLNIFFGIMNAAFLAALVFGAEFGFYALSSALFAAFFIAPLIAAADALIWLVFSRKKSALRPLVLAFRRRLMELASLPYAAYRDTDAVARAAWRMKVSHKNMLEWQTAADASGAKGKNQYLRLIPTSALGALLVFFAVLGLFPGIKGGVITVSAAFAFAFTLLSGLLMLLSPLIIMHLDGRRSEYRFTDEEREKLIETARRIWRFFDESCTESRHFLPPDNIQLDPPLGAWELTSPTNIGMALMAAVSAHELGFIDAPAMLDRLERLSSTVEKLEKWRGNPFNWYDIKTLSLPAPRFVSSVDCGNLFCCLVTAAGAVDALIGSIDPIDEETSSRVDRLKTRLFALADGMELGAFYDKKRRLFSIGLDFENGRMSESCYDLYASEARLLSFAAVAFHKVEAKHWFSLSRLFCDVKGGRTLKSWSGTAFEYLMPLIFFETAEHSLQYEAVRSAVLTQALEARPDEPWGVSESGFYCFDSAMRYQYHAFGSPALALSRKREADRVIAPYASLLALEIEPKLAVENLEALEKLGLFGEYGYYEAADYTNLPVGAPPRIVKSYMAHHQGMGLCAAANAVTGGGLKKHFMGLARVEASEQLLFENLPTDPIKLSRYRSEVYTRRKTPPSHALEFKEGEHAAACLSNGRYSLIISADGRSVSTSSGTLLTRYRRESGAERGVFFTVTTDKGSFFANGDIIAVPHSVCIEKRLGALKIRQSVFVSAEYDCEFRTIRIVNLSKTPMRCTLGAFAEISLASPCEDEAHPAFVRLCIDSSVRAQTAVFSSRRLEGNQKCAYFGVSSSEKSYICTDGLCVPARGGDALKAAREFHSDCFSSENRGFQYENAPKTQPVEPYFSALTPFELSSGAAFELHFVCGFEADEGSAFASAEAMLSRFSSEERLIAAHSRGRLRALQLTDGAIELASRLAYALLADAPQKDLGKLRPYLSENNLPFGKSPLWRFALSGDLPILILHIESENALHSAALLIGAARYLHSCGMRFELAAIGGYKNEYQNRLRARLEELTRNLPFCRLINGFELTEGDRLLLSSAALIEANAELGFSVLFDAQNGEKHAQKSLNRGKNAQKGLKTAEKTAKKRMKTFELGHHTWQLENFNGFGGFDTDADEYVIWLKKGTRTSLPWSNTFAGARLGTLITESGGGYTFSKNARLNRLTPWSNDALSDKKGERVTLFDAESGEYLPLTPDGEGDYLISHGYFYTRFLCRAYGLEARLCEACDPVLPLKYYCIDIKNCGITSKNIIIELECDFVLGESIRREHIVSAANEWGVRAVNPLSERSETAFLAVKSGGRLIGARVGAVCSIRAEIRLEGGEEKRLVLLLGSAKRGERIEALIEKADHEKALSEWKEFEYSKLHALKINTENVNFDLLINGRLLYQLYTARLFAKTGFYQSGGATGFRDQLQDVCALLMTDPKTARNQLLLSASKQFEAGDVLHWWHDVGRGVRTRIGDDRLFLPLAACEYALVTGDHAVFDEICPYLEDKPIEEGRESRYERFENAGEGSLFEHCVRAVEFTLRPENLGAHDLPLMGAGDWNDGMDKLAHGSESIVTGFLALFALEKMRDLPRFRSNGAFIRFFDEKAKLLRAALEGAWSGKRYYRAYFEDGSPLDIADIVTASFAVFAGLSHAEEGFDNAVSELADYENGLIRLLAPPFEKAEAPNKKPIGYIENYIEGVRENGGQYTHAAAWAVIAACKLKRAEQAESFFRMLNPIEHGGAEAIEKYKAEPYAVCGDVYSLGRLAGRGGWSLYTGAAGWLYRAAIEHILGIKKRGDTLIIEPCTTLPRFDIEYRYGKTRYTFHAVRRGADESAAGANEPIKLLDDGKAHELTVFYQSGTKGAEKPD